MSLPVGASSSRCSKSEAVEPVHRLRAALDQIPAERLQQLPPPEPFDLYSREVLLDTPELMIVVARWNAGARCDLHGHSDAAGLYRVMAGELDEERYLPAADGPRFSSSVLKAEDESYLPRGAVHQLRALADSVTLHAYSPRPDDAVEDVTPELALELDAARRKAHLLPVGRGWQLEAGESLADRARAFAEVWAEQENLSYREGANRLPPRVLEDFRHSGILTLPLPTRWGGCEASLWETANVVRLVARRAPAAALALVMPLGNAATCRIPLSAVPAAQRDALRKNQAWVAAQVGAGRILAVANSEPGAGGDLKNTKTLAHTDEQGVTRLSGKKAFATIGPDADYFLCAARNVEAENRDGGIHVDGYFIHRDAPGLTIDNAWNPFGMRPTASIGLQLADAPATEILGFPGCLEGVNARHWSTVLFAAVFLGIGEASFREGVINAGNSPWARAKLAEQGLALDAAVGFLEAVCHAETWPMPRVTVERVQRAKTFVTTTVVQVATLSATISGGRCYSPNHAVYRLLADALAGPLVRPPLAHAMDHLVDKLDTFAH